MARRQNSMFHEIILLCSVYANYAADADRMLPEEDT